MALLGAWVLTLTPWTAKSANALLLVFSIAAAMACLAGLLSALAATDLTSRFEDFRFSPPLDYPNTTAAFGFMAALPALLLAIRPDASVPAKAFGQGLATFLAAYALLPQSRGSVLGLLAALAIFALFVPYRWRMLWHTLLLGVTLAAVFGPTGDVYTAATTTNEPSGALEDAAFTIGGATFLAIAAGALLAWAERRYSLERNRRDGARKVGLALTGLAVLAVLAVGVAKAGAIGDTLSDQWRSLKHPGVEFSGKQANADSGRLASVDPLERYDYWRVSVGQFLDAPLWGGGAGSFEHQYLIDRRYPKVARFPHNLGVKVLGETGLVGVVAVRRLPGRSSGLGLWRRRGKAVADRMLRRRRPRRCSPTTPRTAPSTGWRPIPVLTGPALAFPLVALAATAPGAGARRRD